MAYQAQVTFERQARLTGSAYRALKDTFYGHDFRQEIETGKAELWRVNGGELWLITRVRGLELIVCCAAGRGLVNACVYLLAAAKQQKLRMIRFHTYKPAFARMINKYFPFKQVGSSASGEYIYRWWFD